MDTINYDPSYADKVREFEKAHNAYVYHVIEAKTQNGVILLSFLFVSDYKEDWQTELLGKDGGIFTYTCPMGKVSDEMEFYEEMGWILLGAPMGYLARLA